MPYVYAFKHLLTHRSQGRVVNMASGLARMMAPSRSVYAITKYAIEGFSDCLRYEMKRWGVKVRTRVSNLLSVYLDIIDAINSIQY